MKTNCQRSPVAMVRLPRRSPRVRGVVLVCLVVGLWSCAPIPPETLPPSEALPSEPPAQRIEPEPPAGAAKSGDSSRDDRPWTAPVPAPDDFDWIRLKSGEWLKGELTVLRRDTLEFDSDELDDLTFEWEDVAEVRSPRMNTCRFDDDTTLVGTLWIRDDVVLMRDASGREHRFPRSWLLAIISGEPSERNRWSGKFSIGFTARRGNTDQTDLTTSLNARRRTPYTRLQLSYLGALGKLDGETNVANHNANLKFDVFLSRRFYLTIPTVEAFRDVFQNIAVRVTPGAGFGYQILDRGGLDWNVEAGGGYRITRYDSVEPGEDETNRNGAALFGTTFEMDITKDIDLKVLYRSQIGIPDTQDTNQHGELALGIELTGDFDLDIALIWDRVGDPRPDADGIVPEKDDFRLTVGVGLEF